MGLTSLPKVRVCRDFSNHPLPRDPYIINEWPLKATMFFVYLILIFVCHDIIELRCFCCSVKHLKDVIERSCGIPVDKQVLLVSGGDSLDPMMRVCSYSAGTDTNPIYLFSKSTIESQSPPSLSIDFGPDMALKEQVDATHNMNDTYSTVVTRVQLAQKFFDHAHDQSRACENLVHDQHLQQQGDL